MASGAIIEANKLKKSFGNLEALKDFSISVKSGEILGIVGPDGAGKSTAMKILSTVTLPDKGELFIGGVNALKNYRSARASIGYMSQKFGLYPDMSVEENIRFFADLQDVPKSEITPRMDTLLLAANMEMFKKRLAKNLSGGMKQKLALCCALIHKPQTLILDEPTNGVDPVSRREFWQLLKKITIDGAAIVYATSYLDEAERCDSVRLMNKGSIITQGIPASLKNIENVTVFEVKGDKARKLIKYIPQSFGEVWSFGSSIHIHAPKGKFTETDIKKVLPCDCAVNIIPASLEDVFAYLTHKSEV